MTYIELLKRIDALAPLPKTVLDIEEFKKTDNYDTNDLVKIIEQDPLMVSTILKTANSAMFGFVSKIDSLSKAVSLLGINFTISIALASGIKNAINSQLVVYGGDSDMFLRIANMQSNFVSLWMNQVDMELKKELILPSFLQESGKFLINNAVMDEGKKDDFLKQVNERFDDISTVEKEFVGMSSADVTSAIFKHWNIAQSIIGGIKYSDDVSKVLPQFEKQAKILNIVKLVCNISKPLDERCIEKARQRVEDFGFDLKPFDAAVVKMQTRISEE
ncbi:MAG: HDOD domain-containing protein [Sulfurimonas sp.]|uniref:HDOD domain-containing protein n=1 Tax=Sulfurimonas sp. TaxID=2022749 RepID=UPI003D14CAA5